MNNSLELSDVTDFMRPATLMRAASAIRLSLKHDVTWEALSKHGRRALTLGSAAIRAAAVDEATVSRSASRLALLDSCFSKLILHHAASNAGRKRLANLQGAIRERDSAALQDERIDSALARLSSTLPESVVNEIRENTKSFIAQLSLSLDDSLAKLGEGKRRGVHLLDVLMDKENRTRARSSVVPLDVALATATRGLLAIVHARFNAELEGGKSAEDKIPDKLLQRLFLREVSAFEGLLRTGQLELYRSCLECGASQKSSETAALLALRIESFLPAFAETQAKIVKKMNQRHGADFDEAAAYGRIAVKTFALTREAVATFTAASRFSVEALSASPSKEFEELNRSVEHLAFDTKLPDGRNTKLSELKKTKEGTLVEIEGFVDSCEASMGQGNFLSTKLTLADKHDTALATVVFLNLSRVGLVHGAYCRLHGHWRSSSKVAGGSAAVEVDRLALDKAGRSSWHIAFLRLANPWFEYLRSGNHLFWSLGKHVWSAGPKQASEGAGELIYPPLIRD